MVEWGLRWYLLGSGAGSPCAEDCMGRGGGSLGFWETHWTMGLVVHMQQVVFAWHLLEAAPTGPAVLGLIQKPGDGQEDLMAVLASLGRGKGMHPGQCKHTHFLVKTSLALARSPAQDTSVCWPGRPTAETEETWSWGGGSGAVLPNSIPVHPVPTPHP